MENKKVTKKEYYEMIKGILESADVENKEELSAFVDKQIEMIDARAERAKAAAATKRAEGDALRAQVEGLLTDEYQTVDTIVNQVQGEDITKSKVVARLTQLVKTGLVEKDSIKVEDKKVMAYRKVVSN